MRNFIRLTALAAVLLAASAGCSLSQSQPPPPPPPGGGRDVNESTLQTQGAGTLKGEVWVDNWFTLWANGKKLIEDSVPITTERLSGSINLRGGRIDDLRLNDFHETVDPTSPTIVLLSPASAPNGYFAEFGWIAGASNGSDVLARI